MSAMIQEKEVLYKRALEYAALKHKGQTRFGGEPYITHPVAVADYLREKGYGTEYLITALFHDLLEDTDATEEEIEALGGKAVLKSVKLLTKEKNYVMSQYIAGIKSDEMAFVVKGADRLHNLMTAIDSNNAFKKKYAKESIMWYLDFLPEIKEAVCNLIDSID